MGAILASQLVRHPQEGAIEHRAIIVGEIDEPRFHHEPAQFDQLARPLASLHLPVAHTGSRLHQFNPMPHGDQPPRHSLRRD